MVDFNRAMCNRKHSYTANLFLLLVYLSFAPLVVFTFHFIPFHFIPLRLISSRISFASSLMVGQIFFFRFLFLFLFVALNLFSGRKEIMQ